MEKIKLFSPFSQNLATYAFSAKQAESGPKLPNKTEQVQNLDQNISQLFGSVT